MVELAHILRQFGPAYQQAHQDSLLPSHRRALVDIGNCRTAVFGGHLYTCQDCHATQYSYHSCQNRHCPKCQHQAGQEWLLRQQELLLPVPYFLLTFTLPAEIRPLARSHQKLIYNLLFRASAAATQQLAQAARFVGGQIGMIGVLHTWGGSSSLSSSCSSPCSSRWVGWARPLAADSSQLPSSRSRFVCFVPRQVP